MNIKPDLLEISLINQTKTAASVSSVIYDLKIPTNNRLIYFIHHNLYKYKIYRYKNEIDGYKYKIKL